jgi:Ca2+-binding EF-hand superfamily protein
MASSTDEQLRKEFKRMDKNNDNTITIEELKKYYLPMQEMLGISPQLAELEIQGLVKRLDNDQNGTISFEGKKRCFSIDCLYFYSCRIQEIYVSKLN